MLREAQRDKKNKQRFTLYIIEDNMSTKEQRKIYDDNFKTKNPYYPSWVAMKGRCYDKNNVQYHNYGGRGIIVCDRWLNSYKDFEKDMKKKGKRLKRMSLDRIDNNEKYCPSNCKWSTAKEQCRNSRNVLEARMFFMHGKRFRVDFYDMNSKRISASFLTEVEAVIFYKKYSIKYNNNKIGEDT